MNPDPYISADPEIDILRGKRDDSLEDDSDVSGGFKTKFPGSESSLEFEGDGQSLGELACKNCNN